MRTVKTNILVVDVIFSCEANKIKGLVFGNKPLHLSFRPNCGKIRLSM